MQPRGKANIQPLLMLAGVLAGIGLGGFFPSLGTGIGFIGDIFLKALLMLALPLVVTSMIAGVCQLGDVRKLGALAGRTVAYFLFTTSLAAMIGVALVTLIHPGRAGEISAVTAQALPGDIPPAHGSVGRSVRDIFIGLVPENIFKAMADNELLPVMVFSLMLGGALTTLEEKGKTAIAFFDGVNAALMKVVDLLMWLAPMGIGALIAGRLGEAGGFSGFSREFARLGSYVVTVLCGLAIQAVVILPLILHFLGRPRIGTLRYARRTSPAWITAFSTASSVAALPITMESTQLAGVSSRISSFVVPLGATINMNGTALYEAVAAVFIAQLSGIPLSEFQLLIIVVTSSLAAVGAAAIPEAGLVTMVIVLKAVGLPTDSIGLLLIIDWFLDRCRTAVNVWGDAVGAAVIDHMSLQSNVLAEAGESTAGSDA